MIYKKLELWETLFRGIINLDMNFAILSNSYGEDRSGAIIGRELKKIFPDVRILGAALISMGEKYKKRGIGDFS